MKKSATTLCLLFVSTALGFAATPQQLGAWSVYTADGNLASNRPVLLQTTSEEQYRDEKGNPVQAKLDVICNHGKVSAIALEPNFAIQASAISLSGAVPTTRIVSLAEGQASRENWEVLGSGRTLSPYLRPSRAKWCGVGPNAFPPAERWPSNSLVTKVKALSLLFKRAN